MVLKSPFEKGKICVIFYYHMFGYEKHEGRLDLYSLDKRRKWSSRWMMEGRQQERDRERWRKAMADVNLDDIREVRQVYPYIHKQHQYVTQIIFRFWIITSCPYLITWEILLAIVR